MPKKLKTKPPKNVVEVKKNRAFGNVPLYIGLAQRHFEKEQPTEGYQAKPLNGLVSESGTYKMPVDLAGMVLPVEYVAGVDSIELHYERTI